MEWDFSDDKWKTRLDIYSPYATYLGAKIVQVKKGYALVELPFNSNLKQLRGLMHGGCLASLADIAMSTAMGSCFDEPVDFVTLEYKINYISPITDGRAVGEARVTSLRKRIAFVEFQIFNEKNEISARGMGTFFIKTKG
ncbi:MAG: PaaI family thioesterase [Candidatus Aenigmatarchaeota archaeon]